MTDGQVAPGDLAGRAATRMDSAFGELRPLLWTRPCDLAAATRALANFQRALSRPEEGA